MAKSTYDAHLKESQRIEKDGGEIKWRFTFEGQPLEIDTPHYRFAARDFNAAIKKIDSNEVERITLISK